LKTTNCEESEMNKSMQKVVDTLQAHMEEGVLVWHNPCLLRSQSNIVTGNAYRGVNQFVTAMVADTEGYQSPFWATFNQIKALGGNLVNAKGKGVPIIFYKSLPATHGEEEGQKRFVIRNSHVFNLDLVSGIDTDSVNVDPVGQASLDQDAQAVVAAYLEREKLSVNHGSPAYVPAIDAVRMPSVNEVLTTDEYYSTYFHELSHYGDPRIMPPLLFNDSMSGVANPFYRHNQSPSRNSSS
jgi:antirestriction protein ArdC